MTTYSETFTTNITTFTLNIPLVPNNIIDMAINSTETRMVVCDNNNAANGLFLYVRNSKNDSWSSPVNFYYLSSAGTLAETFGLTQVPFYNIAMSSSGDRLVVSSYYTTPRVFIWNSSTLTYDEVGSVAYLEH